jgi:hypothetical protein
MGIILNVQSFKVWDTIGLSDTQLQYSNDNSIYSQ